MKKMTIAIAIIERFVSEQTNMIKIIIFDIGRVLIGFEWKEYIHRLFDEKTAQRVTDAIWQENRWYELDRGVLSEKEILESFYQAEPELKREIKEPLTGSASA